MAQGFDFIVKNGLQVSSNLVVGTYTNNVTPVSNGAIISGNVGIGTASPTQRLHVVGNIQIANTAAISGIRFPDGTFQNTAFISTTAVRQSFSASLNQTVFTVAGGYTPGQIDVYYNGVKLLNGTEVDVSSGTSVVLISPAAAGADIDVVAFRALNVLNAVSKSGDTMTGDLAITAGNLIVNTDDFVVNRISGNVGIGTVSPQANLHVMGNIFVANSGAAIGGIRFPDGTFQSTAAGSSSIPPGVNSASNVTVTATSTNASFFPAFVEATTGNIGIRVDTGLTYNPNTDTLSIAGNVLVQNGGRFGNVSITNTTTSTSTTTGALVVAGGIATLDNIYAAGNASLGLSGNTNRLGMVAGNNQTAIYVQSAATPGDFLLFQDSNPVTRFRINSVGNITAGGWNGSTIEAQYGGTGFSSYTTGNLLYAGTTSTLAQLGITGTGVGSGNVLLNNGSIPTWGSITLSNQNSVTGILPLANGGTNAALTAAAGAMAYSTASAMALTSPGSLAWDNANARLGLGVASPSQTLDVNGAALFRSNLRILSTTQSTSTTAGALVVDGGIGIAGNLFVGGSINGANVNVTGSAAPPNGLFLPSANNLAISTSSTERLRIDSLGNVSIGTASVLTPLGTRTTLTLDGPSTQMVFGVGGTSRINITAAAAASILSQGANFNMTVGTANSGSSLIFQTVSVERARIDTNGFLGIGTNVPSQPLDVNGNTLIRSNAAVIGGNAATSTTTGALTVAGGVGITGNLHVGGTIFGVASTAISASNVTVVQTLTDTNFFPVFAEASSGNVTMRVNGTGFLYNPATNTVTLAGNALVQNGGRFGNLSITNTTQSTSTSSGAVINAGGMGIAGNLFVGGSINGANVNVTGSAAPPNGIFLPATDTLGFATTSSERVRITSAGRMGIGTSVPSSNLHVMGNITISNSAGVISGVVFADGTYQNTAATSTPIPSGVNSASNVAVTATTTDAVFYPTFVEATSGNLGIRVDSFLSYNPSTDLLSVVGGIISQNIGRFGNLSVTNTTTSTSSTTGALVVAGGVGIGANLTVGGTSRFIGNVTIDGNLFVLGNTTVINTDQLSVEDPLIQIGTGPAGQPLQADDGLDRGLIMHQFRSASGGDTHSYLGRQNSSGRLLFVTNVQPGATNIANPIIPNSPSFHWGTAQFGNLVLSGNANAVATSQGTGALVIEGSAGASIGGNLYVGGTIFGVANTAINASNIAATLTNTNATFFPVFVEATTGNIGARTDSGFTYNPSTETLTLQALSSAAATALLIDSGTTGDLNIGTGANAKNITIGNLTGATRLLVNAGTGGTTFNTPGTSSVIFRDTSAPTVDTVQIIPGFGIATAGVNALSVTYAGGAAAIESSATRTDIAPSGTAGSTWSAYRIVSNGAVAGVTLNAMKVDNITATAGSNNALWIGSGWGNVINLGNSVLIRGDGSYTGSVNNINVISTTTNATFYPAFFENTSGALAPRVDTAFTYNPSTDALTAGQFIPSSSTAPSAGMFLPAANTIGFAANSGERMRIETNGNVSIGATTANGRLYVRAGWSQSATPVIRAEDLSGSWMQFIANSSPGSWNPMVQTGDTTITYSQGVSETGTLFIGQWSTANKGIRIDRAGNVGIGTATPLGNLHVMGNLWLSNNAAFIGGIRFPDGTFQTTAATGGGGAIPPGVNSASNVTVTSTATDATFFPAFVEATTGNIGIRVDTGLTYNPNTDTMSLAGNILVQNGARVGNITATNATASTSTNTGAIVTSGGVGISGNVYAGGNISVGLSNNTNRLGMIAGNNQTAIYVQSAASAGDFLLLQDSNPITKFRIDSAGNIATGGWNGSTIGAIYGGTGFGSYVTGDILYASSTSSLARLPISGAGIGSGNVLINSGGIPTWGSVANINVATTSTNATFYPVFVEAVSGNIVARTDAELTYNPATDTMSITGNMLVQNGGRFGNISVTNATASTSTSTGALTIAGGAGISGNVYAGNAFITSNVGVGTSVMVSGYVMTINGGLAATTKSFVIDHPTKPGMKLRYGSLEGPENGVYFRGRLKDSNRIVLPDYWSKLVDPDSITVNLTPIGEHRDLYVESVGVSEIVVGQKLGWFTSSGIDAYFVVFAERRDVDRLQVEV